MNDILEQLIDRNSLQQVLEALAEVCECKAEHVSTNWQDNDLSSMWQSAADDITYLADAMAKNYTPGISK